MAAIFALVTMVAACSSSVAEATPDAGVATPSIAVPTVEITMVPSATPVQPTPTMSRPAEPVDPVTTATARPAPTVTPTVAPTSTPTPIPLPPTLISSVDDIPEPPRRDPIDLTRRLHPDRYDAYLQRSDDPKPPVIEGEIHDFSVLLDTGAVTVSAVAERVSEHAYWFFDTQLVPFDTEIDEAVQAFEERIWPSVTGLFGSIETPGVDGDPRLVILHTQLDPGFGGYFSAADAFPAEVMELSNEREIIYIASVLRPGSNQYAGVLAHELQHAANFGQDRGDEAWLNEGLSELAVVRTGYNAPTQFDFLREPDTQLNSWPNSNNTGSSYGAGQLFTEYVVDRFGGDDAILGLVQAGSDGLNSIEEYLELMDADIEVVDLFRDWTVANLVDEESGKYAYPSRELARVQRKIAIDTTSRSDTVNQFAADYWTLLVSDELPTRITFTGDETTRIIPTSAHSGDACYWGNAGDSIDAKLTRAFDLTDVESATLEFAAWYETEELWDFAYALVSSDDGATWTLLEGPNTTDRNPNGTGLGHGFTGSSGGWKDQSFDLSPYAGGEILVRFEHVTDDAVNVHGICVDDIAISEIDYFDDAEGISDWEFDGFAQIDPTIRQEWLISIVREPSDGAVVVERVEVELGAADFIVWPPEGDEEVYLLISAATRVSILPAEYTLNFEIVS